MFINRKHTKETKEKMRLARIGIVFSQEHKDNIKKNHSHCWKGKKHTEEQKRKIGLGNKGKFVSEETKKKLRGENHYNWKGGITPEYIAIRNSKEMSEWRNNVYKRDNYTCTCCGDDKGGNLNADHIIPFIFILEKLKFEQGNDNLVQKAKNYPLLWDINNGRTLCRECHRKTDTYGKKAFNYK